MSNKQWTVAAAGILALSVQFGCQGTGRFSREQYAQFDADPFLASEHGRTGADEDVAGLMAASETNGRPDRVDTANGPRNKSDEESVFSSVDNLPRKELAGSAPGAPTTPDFSTSLAQGPPAQTTGISDDGFDEFLRQNEDKIVQVSTVLQEDLSETSSAHHQVIQADHSVFPAVHQKVEKQDPVDGSFAAETNPFAVPDALSEKASGSSDHNVSWRPDNFKDVMLAE